MNRAAAADRPSDASDGAQPATEYRERVERLLAEPTPDTMSTSADLRLARRLWPFFRPQLRLLVWALLLIPVTAAAGLAQPYLVKRTLDSVLVERSEDLWLMVIGLFAATVLVEFVARFAQMYCMQLAGQRGMAELRRSVFGHALRTRTGYYDRTPIGRVLTRVTNDVDAIGELFSSGAVMAVADILMVVGIVAVMLWLDWRLSLIAFAVLPPLGVLVEVMRRKAREAFRDIRGRIAQLNAYLSEQVQGVQVVQAFGREAPSQAEYAAINDAYRVANHRAIQLDASLYSVVESVSIGCVALVLFYSADRVAGLDLSGAQAHIGTFAALYQCINLFFVPIRDLSQKYTIIQSSLASAERVFGFLDDGALEDHAPSKDAGRSMDPSAPAVAFRKVTFGYRPGEPVLRDVDFEVKRGEHVAIVGATGAGKTSTISLLLRLYDIDSGSIELSGKDQRSLSLPELRRQFALVPQDVFLFRGTLADNVALSLEGCDLARVEDCLRRVGAWDLVQRRQGGLYSRVEERGSNFSAGERQLIAFARALYVDAPLLVLDEATANIDSESEARLQAAVTELMRGRTAIVIAHRLSTIEQSDRILVFHKGRIVEQGTHRELLELGQVYAHLHRLQFDRD